MRNISIDILKIALAIFVLFLHLGIFHEEHPLVSYLLVNGLFRIAVPLFLLISGYYFYNVDNSVKLRKWLFRLLLLYLVWMIIYLPTWLKEFQLTKIALTIFFGHGHLWYLIGTLFAGLILYQLRNFKTKLLLLIIGSLFLICYIIQTIGNLYTLPLERDNFINESYVFRNFLLFCLPFLALGFIIRKEEWNKRFNPSLYLVLSTLILVLIESWVTFSTVNNEEIELLVSLIICCPLIFLFTINIQILSNNKELANFSTAIYLIHILVLGIFKRLNCSSWNPFLEVSGILLSTFVISYLLVLINKRVNFLL